jgi:hypothetical protein
MFIHGAPYSACIMLSLWPTASIVAISWLLAKLFWRFIGPSPLDKIRGPPRDSMVSGKTRRWLQSLRWMHDSNCVRKHASNPRSRRMGLPSSPWTALWRSRKDLGHPRSMYVLSDLGEPTLKNHTQERRLYVFDPKALYHILVKAGHNTVTAYTI